MRLDLGLSDTNHAHGRAADLELPILTALDAALYDSLPWALPNGTELRLKLRSGFPVPILRAWLGALPDELTAAADRLETRGFIKRADAVLGLPTRQELRLAAADGREVKVAVTPVRGGLVLLAMRGRMHDGTFLIDDPALGFHVAPGGRMMHFSMTREGLARLDELGNQATESGNEAVAAGRSYVDVQTDLARLVKDNGNAWPERPIATLAKELGCAPGTVLKARDNDTSLKARYAEHRQAAKTATVRRLSDVDHGRTAQTREADPADTLDTQDLLNRLRGQAAEAGRKYIDSLSPKEQSDLAELYGRDPDTCMDSIRDHIASTYGRSREHSR